MDNNQAESSKKDVSREKAIKKIIAKGVPEDQAIEYHNFSGPYPDKPLQARVVPLEILLNGLPSNIEKGGLLENFNDKTSQPDTLQLARILNDATGDKNKAIGYAREIARRKALKTAEICGFNGASIPKSFETTNALDVLHIIAKSDKDSTSIKQAEILYRKVFQSKNNGSAEASMSFREILLEKRSTEEARTLGEERQHREPFMR